MNSAAITGAASILLIAGGMVNTALDPNRAALTTTQNSISTNAIATEITAEAAQQSTALANERYKSGACVRSTAPITQGMGVSPQYAGMILCDAHGTTAVIAQNGALTLIARTGDTAIITEGLK